jgi:hypothetical protein
MLSAKPESANEVPMADGTDRVKRVLHVKLRALGDPKQMLALVQSATPFYRAFGSTRIRTLQNVDDPAQLLIEIEYEANAGLELNRQKVASDPMMRSFLTGWKQMLAGSADMDVYEDVSG